MQEGSFRDLRHKSNMIDAAGMNVCAQQEVVAMHRPFFAFSWFYLQRSSHQTVVYVQGFSDLG